MALATTCPHCKTSFKVVADQLKLRRGLVRCGKCQEVFSGVDYLRYIDDPTPRSAAPAAPGPKVFAPAAPAPEQPGIDAAHTRAAPQEVSLDDLKTAFFLPETVFNASVMVDPVTIQAPVPVYIPSPEFAPSSQHPVKSDPAPVPVETAAPAALAAAPATPTTPTPANSYNVPPSDPMSAPVVEFSTAPLDEPAAAHFSGSPAQWHDERTADSQRSRGADQPAQVEQDPSGAKHHETKESPDSAGMAGGESGDSAGAVDGAVDRTIDRTIDGTIDSDTLPGDRPRSTAGEKDATASDAGTRVEQAALRLSRIPDGVDLGEKVLRAAPAVRSFVADEPPANGAHFASGLDDEDHLAADATSPAPSDRAIDFAAPPRKPPAKWWPALAACLLVLALGQALLSLRNEIAVHWPELKPSLAGLVEPLGLKIELPRRYDAVTIESFELQASELTAGEVQSYFAQALLRNHAGYAVQWPAIELSLTDPNGQLLARKVLLAADYLGTADLRDQGFAAKSERTVRVRLGLNQITPNGYSAVLFYP